MTLEATTSAPIVLDQPKELRFQVEAGGAVYSLPLFTALKFDEIQKLNKAVKADENKAMRDYMERYCPGITSALTVGQISQVIKMLVDASGGAEQMGES